MLRSKGPIGGLFPGKPITIIGGGISGLFIGHYLKRKNIPFLLIEKEKFLGGKIGTIKNDYGLNEKAANAIFANEDVYELLSELGIAYDTTRTKLRKVIWRKNKPQSPPVKILEILLRLPFLLKKPNYAEDSTVFDFFSPLLGEKLCHEVLAPIFAGIYAEDISKLHFISLFKSWNNQKSYFQFLLTLFKNRKKQKTKAQSLSFPGGMQDLVNALKEELKDEIMLEKTIQLEKNQNYIICTDAHEASNLMNPLSPEIAKSLADIQYNKLSTATLITESKIPFLKNAFGILFSPTNNKLNSLGILANSEIFANRTSHHKLSSYTFILKTGSCNEEHVFKDLEVLHQSDISSDRKSIEVIHWDKALPIYNFNRYKNILKLRSQMLEYGNGPVIFGNYVDGISLRDILGHAKNFVSNINQL